MKMVSVVSNIAAPKTADDMDSKIIRSNDKVTVPFMHQSKGDEAVSHTKFLSFDEYWGNDIKAANATDDKRTAASHYTDPTMPPEHNWLRGTSDTPKTTKIPKIIHKVYIEKSGLFPTREEMAPNSKLSDAHQSWSIMNPDYEIRYFNLNHCRQYLMDTFHPVFLRAFDCIEAFSGKVNLFRMLVVYAEGGWYSDWKQHCMVPNALNKMGQNVNFSGIWDHGNSGLAKYRCVQNCLFGAVPHHPLVAQMIVAILNRVQTEKYNVKHALYTTGTCTFGQVFRAYNATAKDKQLRMGYFDSQGYIVPKLGGTRMIQHKCDGCGTDQNWKEGNDYNELFKKRQYYCQDANALFGAAAEILRQ